MSDEVKEPKVDEPKKDETIDLSKGKLNKEEKEEIKKEIKEEIKAELMEKRCHRKCHKVTFLIIGALLGFMFGLMIGHHHEHRGYGMPCGQEEYYHPYMMFQNGMHGHGGMMQDGNGMMQGLILLQENKSTKDISPSQPAQSIQTSQHEAHHK